MPNPLIRKLEHGATLSEADRTLLENAMLAVRSFGPGEDLIRQGDKPDKVHVVIEGLVCRYKLLNAGTRQIVAYLVPGDMCDLHVSILGEMDHGIGTISACKIAYLPRAVLEDLFEKSQAITRALWWATLVDEAVLREWLVNMGRRQADKQIAHLLCELLMRLNAVGLAADNTFAFTATQQDLGDTLGLSTVHVNRVLQQLRATGLITSVGRTITVNDVPGLMAFAEFDRSYLHLNDSASPRASRLAG